MQRNIGTTDRVVRTVLGIAAAVGAFPAGITSPTGIVLVVVAAVLVATGAVASSPLYAALRLSTVRQPSTRPAARV